MSIRVLIFQSLRNVFLRLSFKFSHLRFYSFVRLVHRRGLIQFVLRFNFVFIDTHVFRLTSRPLQKCWNLMTILLRVPGSTNSATGRRLQMQ